MGEQIESQRIGGERRWLQDMQAATESWSAAEVIEWALVRFGRRIALASAFGPEGMALIDIAKSIRPDVKVFTLDTGLFFPETYELIEKVERRYSITIERVKPALTVDEQAARHGASLWQSSPDRCCYMRKIEQLRRNAPTHRKSNGM